MKKHILIIEDDELLREVYATKLKMEGFKVTTASNGAEGLSKATSVKPDVILLDMLMPYMTGLEFLQAYQPRTRPSSALTLVLSNKSSAVEINQAKAMGAIEYLIKSQHTPQDIVAHIRHHLNEHS